MKAREHIVVDTNLLVSRLLLPASPPARALRRAVDEGQPLVSEATMTELAEVLTREKLDPHGTLEERRAFLRLLGHIALMVPIVHRIRACRDRPASDIPCSAEVLENLTGFSRAKSASRPHPRPRSTRPPRFRGRRRLVIRLPNYEAEGPQDCETNP